MYKNRLIELSQISGKPQRVGSRLVIPASIVQIRQEIPQLEQFIDEMSSQNNILKKLIGELQITVNPEKEKNINKQFSRVANENRELMSKVETGLNELRENQKKDIKNNNKGNTIQAARIVQKANKAITEFKQNQQSFADLMRNNIRRQAHLIENKISEQQVNDIMANPERGQSMLQAKLLNSPSIELDNNVSDIIDKYNDIIKLEKNMHECLEMMHEMVLLVALTGEQLDSIEKTIGKAKDFTEHGEKKLVGAKGIFKSGQQVLVIQHTKCAVSQCCCCS